MWVYVLFKLLSWLYIAVKIINLRFPIHVNPLLNYFKSVIWPSSYRNKEVTRCSFQVNLSMFILCTFYVSIVGYILSKQIFNLLFINWLAQWLFINGDILDGYTHVVFTSHWSFPHNSLVISATCSEMQHWVSLSSRTIAKF